MLSSSKQHGQGITEYTLVLVLVTIILIIAVATVGPVVANLFGTVNASLGG